MAEVLLLLAGFLRDARALLDHLPPPEVSGPYSRMCWTWDSVGWFWYYAHEARQRACLAEQLEYAAQARRCVTPKQWASQQWPVPAFWRDSP